MKSKAKNERPNSRRKTYSSEAVRRNESAVHDGATKTAPWSLDCARREDGKSDVDAGFKVDVGGEGHVGENRMTLPEILHYLDTTSRVSCPQITCEQAAEIAEMLRDGSVSFYRGVIHSLDCTFGEMGVGLVYCPPGNPCLTCKAEGAGDIACGFAWDCGREVALLERVTDSERKSFAMLFAERDELKLKLLEVEARLTGRPTSKLACAACQIPAIGIEHSCSLRPQRVAPVEATGDLDPGVYEGTGKGFEK